MRSLILPALLACLSVGPAAAAPELAELLKPCAECHGADGVASQPGIPHLNGQSTPYTVATLEAYLKGRRSSRVDRHIPPGLSAATLNAIAVHYEKIKATRAKQVTDADKVGKAAAIYHSRCADCHPDNGRDVDKDSPLLAAQNLDYLTEQIKDFARGKRSFPFMMDEAYRDLKDEDLEMLAHFFASQDETAPPSGKKKRKR
ncbi:MAG TPA: c-type cytochrome [Rhodocyclaceae bacterium]|nr:c-type cytochrome [Rhodocyclaceae bacterium]